MKIKPLNQSDPKAQENLQPDTDAQSITEEYLSSQLPSEYLADFTTKLKISTQSPFPAKALGYPNPMGIRFPRWDLQRKTYIIDSEPLRKDLFSDSPKSESVKDKYPSPISDLRYLFSGFPKPESVKIEYLNPIYGLIIDPIPEHPKSENMEPKDKASKSPITRV